MCANGLAHLKDGHAIIYVRAGLAIGEPVEEAPKAQPLCLLPLLALRVLHTQQNTSPRQGGSGRGAFALNDSAHKSPQICKCLHTEAFLPI
jgi:hypothetical protein